MLTLITLAVVPKGYTVCEIVFWNNFDGLNAGLGIRSFEFRVNCSFFVQKWANEQFPQKNERFTHLLIYSFLVSDLSDSLIFGERPERFAHDCSFPLSDLSKSLMVAHFWWVIWAIRSHSSFDLSEMSDSLTKIEKMSKNERFAHFFKKNVF